MTISVRVHFDGKVLVPDEPLNLPIDQQFDAVLQALPEYNIDDKEASAALERIKSRSIPGVSIPLEYLSREYIYEDRL